MKSNTAAAPGRASHRTNDRAQTAAGGRATAIGGANHAATAYATKIAAATWNVTGQPARPASNKRPPPLAMSAAR